MMYEVPFPMEMVLYPFWVGRRVSMTFILRPFQGKAHLIILLRTATRYASGPMAITSPC